jgi:hypothetical protein
METYNVYIDSYQASIGNAGSVNNEYYVNWASIMPDGSYNVSFSFISQSDDIYIGAEIATVLCNLGGNNQFKANGSVTNVLGFLSTVNIAIDNSYLYAEITANPKVYLKQRPNVNSLIVSVCNGLDTTDSVNIVHYTMVLHFEKL